MVELDMEINNFNYPKFGKGHLTYKGLHIKYLHQPINEVSISKVMNNDVYIKPVANKSVTGFLSLIDNTYKHIKNYVKNYKANITHTYQHKLVFAKVEKELFGQNSLDSLTHDLDKLILYILGFPHDFVSGLHKKISEHHIENHRNKNLRSMLCDNIASSPKFKPEKKYNLRDFYQKSSELQSVKGFGKLLEKYNYGENLNFDKIKQDCPKNSLMHTLQKAVCILFFSILVK